MLGGQALQPAVIFVPEFADDLLVAVVSRPTPTFPLPLLGSLFVVHRDFSQRVLRRHSHPSYAHDRRESAKNVAIPFSAAVPAIH